MIWWIVRLKDPRLGLADGNVQLMLNENKTPKAFLSPESAYTWAEMEGLPIDNYYVHVIDRETKEYV